MNVKQKKNTTDGTATADLLGILRFGSNWRPTSPKTQELKARNIEARTLNNNKAFVELKHDESNSTQKFRSIGL